MGITADVEKALATFEEQNPDLKGKAYPTSGDRTWEEQLDIILDPKRKANYTGIKGRFLKKFKLTELPAKRSDLTAEQLSWWDVEIMKQAGQSPGFPHVGGKAQDVSVKNLDKDQKTKLEKVVTDAGCKILMEYVTGNDSQYGVSIDKANVFHIYK